MKHTVVTNAPPEPRFIPITFAVTLESREEATKFLKYIGDSSYSENGISYRAYEALEEECAKQGIKN